MTRSANLHRIARFALPPLIIGAAVNGASAASFGELSSGPPAMTTYGATPYNGGNPVMAGPYSTLPNQPCPPSCATLPVRQPGNAEGQRPMLPDHKAQSFVPAYQANPRAHLPIGSHGDQPAAQVQLWTYGQVNSTTDPFNPWGLSTPYMFVPWSTPLSGWTNAQTWNWWRERSGALPRNW